MDLEQVTSTFRNMAFYVSIGSKINLHIKMLGHSKYNSGILGAFIWLNIFYYFKSFWAIGCTKLLDSTNIQLHYPLLGMSRSDHVIGNQARSCGFRFNRGCISGGAGFFFLLDLSPGCFFRSLLECNFS